ncbi:MAG TPA: hypothetical protein VGJ87_25985 [Roseiflexaceae bacterium]|jgi:hypothetical protein
MSNQPCGDGVPLVDLSTPIRNHYFYGKLLDAYHFELEQRYFNHKRSLINRLVLGSGVVCGLDIAATRDGPMLVVGPGVAIDAAGREIVVPAASPAIDPRQLTNGCGRPTGERIEAGPVTICLVYYECAGEPVPVLVSSGCDGERACAPSVVRERYAIVVQKGAPPPVDLGCGFSEIFGPRREGVPSLYAQLVERVSKTCGHTDDTCVVLARVDLDGGAISAVDLNVRPLVLGNDLLFDLLLCLAARVDECCGQAPTPEPMRVAELEFINRQGVTLRRLSDHLDQPVRVRQTLGELRVTFDRAPNVASIKAGDSFRVATMGRVLVPGRIVVDPKNDRVVSFVIEGQHQMSRGKYRLELVSDPARLSITSSDKMNLDGEFIGRLPSGHGTAGGSFVLEFTVTASA